MMEKKLLDFMYLSYWTKLFEGLKKYIERHGNCLVPKPHKEFGL